MPLRSPMFPKSQGAHSVPVQEDNSRLTSQLTGTPGHNCALKRQSVKTNTYPFIVLFVFLLLPSGSTI